MRPLFIILILSLSASVTYAQAPFTTIDSIDGNSINASVLRHGGSFGAQYERVETFLKQTSSHAL